MAKVWKQVGAHPPTASGRLVGPRFVSTWDRKPIEREKEGVAPKIHRSAHASQRTRTGAFMAAILRTVKGRSRDRILYGVQSGRRPK